METSMQLCVYASIPCIHIIGIVDWLESKRVKERKVKQLTVDWMGREKEVIYTMCRLRDHLQLHKDQYSFLSLRIRYEVQSSNNVSNEIHQKYSLKRIYKTNAKRDVRHRKQSNGEVSRDSAVESFLEMQLTEYETWFRWNEFLTRKGSWFYLSWSIDTDNIS